MAGSFTWNRRLYLTNACATCGKETQVFPLMGLDRKGRCIYCRQRQQRWRPVFTVKEGK